MNWMRGIYDDDDDDDCFRGPSATWGWSIWTFFSIRYVEKVVREGVWLVRGQSGLDIFSSSFKMWIRVGGWWRLKRSYNYPPPPLGKNVATNSWPFLM